MFNLVEFGRIWSDLVEPAASKRSLKARRVSDLGLILAPALSLTTEL
jgi:hypothetical protein